MLLLPDFFALEEILRKGDRNFIALPHSPYACLKDSKTRDELTAGWRISPPIGEARDKSIETFLLSLLQDSKAKEIDFDAEKTC